MSELIVMAHFECEPSNRAAVKEIIDQLCVDSENKEEGCVSYHALEEIDNPGTCTTLERWASPEAEAAHWETEHLKRALDKVAPLLSAEPRIHKYYACAK